MKMLEIFLGILLKKYLTASSRDAYRYTGVQTTSLTTYRPIVSSIKDFTLPTKNYMTSSIICPMKYS